AHRLAGGGTGLRAARDRQILHQRRAGARLRHRARNDDSLHGRHPHHEPAGRHHLFVARSAGEVPLMAGLTSRDTILTEYAKDLEAQEAPKGRSLTADAVRRLMSNKAAVLSIFLLLTLIVVAFAGPYLLPWSYGEVDWSSIRKAPDFAKGHYMGTDQ